MSHTTHWNTHMNDRAATWQTRKSEQSKFLQAVLFSQTATSNSITNLFVDGRSLG